MSLVTDPEVLAFIAATEAAYPADSNGASAVDNRRFYDAMCAVFRKPHPPGIATLDETVDGVPVRVYRRAARAAGIAAGGEVAVLYAHGGGFVVGSLESHDDVCAEIAEATGFAVVSVDYRLAPEHRHPAQLDDVETIWRAVSAAFARVVAAGDSAGACLVAGLALRLRRRGLALPSGMVLVYPGLGGDRDWPSYHDNAEAPMLRTVDLPPYEAARFGGMPPEGPPDEARPLATTDYSGLPPMLVVTADVDPLRDDGIVFVERVRAAGGQARIVNMPQLVHGFLRARHMSRQAGLAFATICEGVARFGA